MKRNFLFVLIIAMLLTCGACGSSSDPVGAPPVEHVTEVETEPTQIEHVKYLIDNLHDKSTREEYKEAKDAFDKLRTSQRQQIAEYKDLLDKIDVIIKERENVEARGLAEQMITDLPEDPEEAYDLINEVNTAMRELTQEQKDLIPIELQEKYDKLTEEINVIRERKRKEDREKKLEETIVVISATGSKYHKPSCHTLTYDGTQMTAMQAINSGYGACNVCKPLSYDSHDSWLLR